MWTKKILYLFLTIVLIIEAEPFINVSTSTPAHALSISIGTKQYAVSTTQNAQLIYYHPDHLGSSSVLTDSNGAVVQSAQYYPFGVTMHEQRAMSYEQQATSYLYTGQEHDDETSLYYYGARYYDPGLCKFMSADMVINIFPQFLNKYSYTLNNPLNLTDPTGNQAEEDNGGFIEKFRNLYHGFGWISDEELPDKYTKIAWRAWTRFGAYNNIANADISEEEKEEYFQRFWDEAGEGLIDWASSLGSNIKMKGGPKGNLKRNWLKLGSKIFEKGKVPIKIRAVFILGNSKIGGKGVDALEEFLKRMEPYKNDIKKVGVFGSFIKGKATEKSDLDVVIVLKEGVSLTRWDKILGSSSRASNKIEKEHGIKIHFQTQTTDGPVELGDGLWAALKARPLYFDLK